jgi:hypothetical protein
LPLLVWIFTKRKDRGYLSALLVCCYIKDL